MIYTFLLKERLNIYLVNEKSTLMLVYFTSFLYWEEEKQIDILMPHFHLKDNGGFLTDRFAVALQNIHILSGRKQQHVCEECVCIYYQI